MVHAPRGAGARLLELADGARTIGDCVTAIGTEYEADAATLERDLLRFAGELVDAGIATVIEP